MCKMKTLQLLEAKNFELIIAYLTANNTLKRTFYIVLININVYSNNYEKTDCIP